MVEKELVKKGEHISFRTGQETAWNMGDLYYGLLAGCKMRFSFFLIEKNVEKLYLNFKSEYILVYPYLLEFQGELKDIDRALKSCKGFLYSSKVGGKAKLVNQSLDDNEALDLLQEAYKTLTICEASKGMLQPKADDPLMARRKYGD